MAYVIPQEILAENRKKEDVGFFESALAGVATGLGIYQKDLYL